MNHLWRVLLVITENWIFRHNFLMVFFLFGRLVFCNLQNQKPWDGQVPETSNRGAWSKWLKPPYSFIHISLIHSYNIRKRAFLLSKIPPHKNSTQHKWHLTRMASHKTAPHKNGISKLTLLVLWSITNTLLIKPTPAIRHKFDLKIPWPWVWMILQN